MCSWPPVIISQFSLWGQGKGHRNKKWHTNDTSASKYAHQRAVRLRLKSDFATFYRYKWSLCGGRDGLSNRPGHLSVSFPIHLSHGIFVNYFLSVRVVTQAARATDRTTAILRLSDTTGYNASRDTPLWTRWKGGWQRQDQSKTSLHLKTLCRPVVVIMILLSSGPDNTFCGLSVSLG